MKRITKIIRPIICMAVLLFAMTTAVMGCYQKDPNPIEDPSGTSEVEAPPSPPSTGSRSLPTPKAKPRRRGVAVYPGAEVDDPVMQAEDNGFDYIDPNPMGSKLTEFFQTVEKKNWLDFDGVTFSEEDSVLTLSTCCRKYDKTNSGNQRLVIMAKLLPEGATEQAFTVKPVKKPEMP